MYCFGVHNALSTLATAPRGAAQSGLLRMSWLLELLRKCETDLGRRSIAGGPNPSRELLRCSASARRCSDRVSAAPASKMGSRRFCGGRGRWGADRKPELQPHGAGEPVPSIWVTFAPRGDGRGGRLAPLSAAPQQRRPPGLRPLANVRAPRGVTRGGQPTAAAQLAGAGAAASAAGGRAEAAAWGGGRDAPAPTGPGRSRR